MEKSLQQFSGKVYPDYSFSIGRVPTPRKLAADREHDREWGNQWDSYRDWYLSRGEAQTEEVFWLDGRVRENKFIKSSESSQKNLSYGKNGISRFGRKMVKNGAVILERKYKISRLGFVTCTIPNYSRRNVHILAKSWSEITRRFFQKLKRHQERLGAPTEIISCTEIQPKRYRATGIVAPHLHFVYICKMRAHDKKFVILANLFRRYWAESVEQALMLVTKREIEKVSFKASVNCQIVKKSVSAYLGKYISKGGEVIEEIKADGMEAFLPKQWWTANKKMKRAINDAIIVLDDRTCQWLFYNLGDHLQEGHLTWCTFIDAEINGELRVVGCAGTFSQDYYALLRESHG